MSASPEAQSPMFSQPVWWPSSIVAFSSTFSQVPAGVWAFQDDTSSVAAKPGV